MKKHPLKILMLHNKYLIRGGEDISTQQESALLRNAGHSVDLVEYDNSEIQQIGQVQTALRSIWSLPAYNDVLHRLSHGNYDLLHVQNFFPLLSPAVHYAAQAAGVPSVQALRNYRIICPKAQLFRNGTDCTRCIKKTLPWDAILHRCYKESRMASAVVSSMLTVHNCLGTWQKHISAYIAVSDFVKNKHIDGGISPDIIYTKPNVIIPAATTLDSRNRQIAYIGRLSPEKGVATLIEAWLKADTDGKLIIAGNGPDLERLHFLSKDHPSILFVGQVASPKVLEIMATSLAVIIPSIWDEPFGRTVIEAFSVGTPVIGSQKGGIAEIIQHGESGLLFPAGSVDLLAKHIKNIFENQDVVVGLRRGAAERFQTHYAPTSVLHQTEEIYRDVIKKHSSIGQKTD